MSKYAYLLVSPPSWSSRTLLPGVWKLCAPDLHLRVLGTESAPVTVLCFGNHSVSSVKKPIPAPRDGTWGADTGEEPSWDPRTHTSGWPFLPLERRPAPSLPLKVCWKVLPLEPFLPPPTPPPACRPRFPSPDPGRARTYRVLLYPMKDLIAVAGPSGVHHLMTQAYRNGTFPYFKLAENRALI